MTAVSKPAPPTRIYGWGAVKARTPLAPVVSSPHALLVQVGI